MRKAIFLTVIFLAACSNYSANLPSIKPYKMEIQQGNAVTPKMMMQLRPGMSKAQVRFVMGTPLIADSFHANRWDYLYRMQKDGRIIEQRRIILDFQDDKLKTVRGDVIPAGSNAATDDASASKAPVTLKSTADPKPKEKGLLDKLQFWKDDAPTPAKPAEIAPEPKQAEAQPAAAPATPGLPDIKEAPEQPLPPLMDESVTAPVVADKPATQQVTPPPAAKPVVAPAAQPEPKAPPAQKQGEKGWLDKLKFWNSDDETAPAKPEAKPAPAVAPKPEPKKIEVKPEPKPETTPALSNASKPAPKPADNLPAEDDPSYFERMLEKIGF